jgi:hypothetical protein
LQLAKKTGKTERSARAEIGDKQRAYLRDTQQELGITFSRMATLVGLAPSTFTRFMKLPPGSEKTLHATSLDKVEQLRQVNSDSPIPTKAQGQWGTLREDAELFIVHGHPDTALVEALASLIGDRNGIEPWVLHTRALELEGFMPGDVVLVDFNAAPQPGDAVYATVQERSGKPENIMRQFQHVGPIDLLVPRTMDPAPPRSLVVDRDRVVIRGVLLPHRLRGRIAA